MAAGSAFWDFTTSLDPTSVAGGFSGVITERGTSDPGRSGSALALFFYPRNTTHADDATRRANGFTVTVGPSAGTLWTPSQVEFDIRGGAVGNHYIQMAVGLTGTMLLDEHLFNTTSEHLTVDLSSLGTVDGPIDLVFWGAVDNSAKFLYVDNIDVTGETLVASDVDLEPTGIASGEAFGGLQVIPQVDIDLLPAGITSSEAFGGLQVLVPPLLDLAVVSIESAESFGILRIGPAASIPTVPYPTGDDVAAFMGQSDNEYIVDLANQHVDVITSLARSYCRGRGFFAEGVPRDVSHVIISATARLVGNPSQIQQWIGTVFIQGGFKGWSLAERVVLNEWRQVAA